jgi:L-ascorbate metabolism protein UlaG (beta-lactamase superfamily)
MVADTTLVHHGHTFLTVQCGDVVLAVDPVLVRRDLAFGDPAAPGWAAPIGAIDAVVLSHSHDDHLHPPSLLGLAPETPIHFPAVCRRATSVLRGLGFTALHPYDTGDDIHLSPAMTVTPIPAEPSVEGTPQFALVVRTDDVTVLDAVDLRDSATTTEALECWRGKLDLAFVPAASSLQWEGGWNQMDVVSAVAFCEWLGAPLVGVCGGALSMAQARAHGRIARYPTDVADWRAHAAERLPSTRVIPHRPPYRLVYEKGALARSGPVAPNHRGRALRAPSGVHAVTATAFTGYDVRCPTRKLSVRPFHASGWAPGWDDVRPQLARSRPELECLLRRCDPAQHLTPAALVVPCTLRWLLRHDRADVAADLVAACPAPAGDLVDVELTLYSLVEAIVQHAALPSEALRDELLRCVALDRGLYGLYTVQDQMREAAYPGAGGPELIEEQLRTIQATVHRRRPILDRNHMLVTKADLPLLEGVVPVPAGGTAAAALLYPTSGDVFAVILSTLEWTLLQLCDGRTVDEITAATVEWLSVPPDHLDAQLFDLLGRLTHASALLVDWSAS